MEDKMATLAGGGANNATNPNSLELVAREKSQLSTTSSSNSKEKGQNDKNTDSTVDREGVDPEVAVTELEPEEPIEDENDDTIGVASSSTNNNDNKKKKKKKKKNKKEKTKTDNQKMKATKKVKNKENNQQQRDELKSNSTKLNSHHESDENKSSKPKSLVEDLKLFQNNHLLNQQDPMQQLHIQLNALIENDDDNHDNHKRVHPNAKPFSPSNSQSNAISRQYPNDKSIDNENNCLSSNIIMQQQQSNNIQKLAGFGGRQDSFDNGENIFTIKKGILWQQQNYDRFHQRLFSRWKKRYFILTTDYLVCFKRSSTKVGRSEMGKFLYKTSLSDVIKIDWSKPKKSDKGAIILHLNKQFNLFLWCKENLDEWMFLIKESAERNKLRRSYIVQNGESQIKQQQKQPNNNIPSHHINSQTNDDGQLYENTALYTNDCSTQVVSKTNAHVKVTPVNHESNLEQQSGGRFSQDSPKASKDGKQRSQHKISDDESSKMKKGTKPYSNNADATSTGSAERVTKSAERELNKDKGNSNKEQNQEDEFEHNNDGAQVSEKGQKRSIMIYDPSDINSDAAINKSDFNVTPKSSPLNAEKDLSSSKSSENSISSQKTNNLTPKKQSSQCTSTRSEFGSKVSKRRSSETNLVSKSKRGSEDQQLKPKLVQEEQHEDVLVDAMCNNIESSIITSDKSVDHNAGCDFKSNNLLENKLASCSNQDTVTSIPEISGHKNKTKVQPALQRPSTNLIRREDSWQSLVSLTRVGKLGPASMQVAQRSLYAQHIMPNTNNDAGDHNNLINSKNGRGIINIESTVTPSRAPFSFQQQSIQPLPSKRKLRPFPPIGQQQHAASFDVAPNSPMQHLNNNYHQTSYQHKLLQLQLLHNSNNVDYIRHNGVGCDNGNNDYQIYGPESIATNHYGYSSMRSNLKSAASEFSFIRPSSLTQHAASQSTLPHKNLHNNFVQLENQVVQSNSNNNYFEKTSKSWLVSSKDNINNNTNNSRVNKSDSNHNELECFQQIPPGQYLINPVTGERIFDRSGLQSHEGPVGTDATAPFSDIMPPMRELPLKPGKKRVANNNTSSATSNANMPKSSSLTYSIACFFRRAFSRRSKRGNSKRRAAKLAESCSSSLGAFEDNFLSVAVAPSAFSTGSKSIDIRKNDQQMQEQQQQQTPQSQRMIDMIEAFTNKTLANENNNLPENVRPPYTGSVIKDSMEPNLIRAQSKQPQLRQRAHLNQFGSPLHKSNSISATMGLSHAQDINDRRNLLYDNELATNAAASGGSPMLMRSNKVMSVNLTPLMSQRERSEGVMPNQQQQFFLSPRNNRQDHQMPRPSSIYGQPSMISSPIITRGAIGLDQGNTNNNFGLHRNSIHNPLFRDKSGQHNNSGLEIRRQQVIKTPFLDTTREVAEDIPSPTTTELQHHNNYDPTQIKINQSLEQSEMPGRIIGKQNSIFEHSSPLSGVSGRQLMMDTRDRNFDVIRASPSSGKLQQKAIVNPILQSPTMDTIYDNHPMLNGPESSTHSHYDNHNQLLMDNSNNNIHRRSPSLRSSNITQFLPSPSITSGQDRYLKHRITDDVSINNVSLNYQRLSSAELDGATTTFDLMMVNKKPSAIVSPTTPNHHQQFRSDGTNLAMFPSSSSPIMDQFGGNRAKLNQAAYSSLASIQQQQQQPPLSQPPQSRSPMLSRRMGHHQTGHYQQSPLVSQQTRVLNKGDGIQATVIGDRESFRYTQQPVVNIAGAPGINLEPSLAASLLRGTNIDAYESSTFSRNASDSLSSKSNSKTFLVSTRLSKSMAQSGQPSSNRDNNSPTSSTFRDESSIISMGNSTTCPKSSGEELSSSGSRSMTSSIGRSCSRVKVLNASRASSQEDQQEDSSSGDNRSGDNNNNNDSYSKSDSKSATKVREEQRLSNNNRKLQRKASDQGTSRHRRRRGSSSEPSDEVGSNAESLSERPEERNWITSKLVE